MSGSGRGIGGLQENPGSTRFSLALPGGSTLSSPAIGVENTFYLGTGDGLLAFDSEGQNARSLSGYRIEESGGCQACTPPEDGCQPLGSISSSPAVTGDGRIVVGTDAGKVLGARDENGQLTCSWVAPRAGASAPFMRVRSSPVVIVDPQDDSIRTVLVGTDAGHLQALNGDGSERWRFLPAIIPGPLDSSPVISALGTVYVSAPDGFLYALDFAGRQLWRFEIGTAAEVPFLPSPAVGTSVYAVGTAGLVTALNPDGTLRWRYTADTTVASSPAYVLQSLNVGEPTPTGTPEPSVAPEATPSVPLDNTPTPTPTPETIFDLVIYVVDVDGTVYAIRDSTATLQARILLGSGTVMTSPTVTGDAFVLVGSEDGFLYAVNLDGAVPCAECEETTWAAVPETQAWRVFVGSATRSSPVIDQDGTIYVTTADGFLHAIGSPLPVTITPTPTATPTSAPTERSTETPA